MSFTETECKILLKVATSAIEQGFPPRQPLNISLAEYPPKLCEPRATFVTLKIHDHLRGCMGTLIAHRPLINDVAHNAQAAAFSDPRFPPLQRSELPKLDLHISVLSIPEPMVFTSEADLLRQLRPGIDGLILGDGHYRGTFLPSVWENLPEPLSFLQHLKQKAGLPPHYWSNTLEVQRYTAESIK